MVKEIGDIHELLGLRESLITQLRLDAEWLAKRYNVSSNGNDEALQHIIPQYGSSGIVEHSDPFFKTQLQTFPIQIGTGFTADQD